MVQCWLQLTCSSLVTFTGYSSLQYSIIKFWLLSMPWLGDQVPRNIFPWHHQYCLYNTHIFKLIFTGLTVYSYVLKYFRPLIMQGKIWPYHSVWKSLILFLLCCLWTLLHMLNVSTLFMYWDNNVVLFAFDQRFILS